MTIATNNLRNVLSDTDKNGGIVMKRLRVIGVLCAVASNFITMSSHAAFSGRLPITPGGTDYQAYYDDQLDITWTADANINDGVHNKGFYEAWAASLTINGVGGWRLPSMDVDGNRVSVGIAGVIICSSDQEACKDNEYGHLFHYGAGSTLGGGITAISPGPFSNVQPFRYMSGTELPGNPTFAWNFSFFDGEHNVFNQGSIGYAWAVRDGDTSNDSDGDGETMSFSYIFVGTNPAQPFAAGARLTGQIDGTIDPMNPDRVIINSFGKVFLTRPTLPIFAYDSIDSDEFNTIPVPGLTPEMSFSGTILNFRSCPEGFDPDFPGDCSFSESPGGGFLMTYASTPLGFATAADGTGDGSGPTAACSGSTILRGCRVLDFPITADNWSLVVLPDNADVDPSVVIGSGFTISKDVVVEEGVVLGENVTVDKNTSIGANTTIGNNVLIDKDVVIEDGVDIGNDTTINQGVHICSGATIGSAVTIGKNNRVLDDIIGVDVPDGIVLNGLKVSPGPCP